MSIFARKSHARTSNARATPSLQIPDELAQNAQGLYGTADFQGALVTYGEAIDKIHTMCVLSAPSSRIRRPGPHDQAILDGFVGSLGALLATDPHVEVDAIVERTTAYLRQIAGAAGNESARYETAITSIHQTLTGDVGRR